MTTVLLTCSRTWTDTLRMRDVLTEVHSRLPDAVLLHGGAKQGDMTAAVIWRELGGTDRAMRADWPTCVPECKPGHRKVNRAGQEYCPGAGHRRNRAMVETAPDLVLAFIDPKSRTKGAATTAEYAEESGIRVVRYIQGEATP